MIDTPNKEQVNAAKRILESSQTKLEEPIRREIISLLEALNVECIAPYQTDTGPADIYCPRYRLFVETKQRGNADNPDKPQYGYSNEETPKEQLERYLRSEIDREKGMLDLDDYGDKRWIGILTDGHVWHAWLYDHHTGAIAREEFRDFHPNTAEELVQKIRSLLSDGPIGKPWIPEDPRPVFEGHLQELEACYQEFPSHLRDKVDTKINLWLELLRTATMEPQSEPAKHRLFVRHTFLVGLARGIIHTLSYPRSNPDCNDILGDGFVAWTVEASRGRTWGTSFLEHIHSFEWRRRQGDVLRVVYEQFIDERDRKVFGEYYTPDWMAEWLVEEVLDEEWCEESVKAVLAAEQGQRDLNGIGVLDPTCGSGTFLYHAVQRILRTPYISDLSISKKASIVARLVNGIDVHPVAAEISRATILRALPAKPLDEDAAIRVYEGDALLILQDDEQSLFYPQNGEVRILTPKGTEVYLPKSFVDNSEFTENLRRMILSAAKNQELPTDIRNSVPESDREMMTNCHQKFIEIISKEGNSVWTWFISNTAGPYRLAQQKVNRIVANPPWVRMADIQSENRKQILERFAKNTLNIWTGGIQAPHFDIAQLFVRRARELYLKNQSSDPAAWIVKKSAMNAGNWDKFRDWHKKYLVQTVDMERIQVFGPGDARRCCVLFECRKGSKLFAEDSPFVDVNFENSRPTTEMNLIEARNLLKFEAATNFFPSEMSEYAEIKGQSVFRQGATIVPRVLLVVEKITGPSGRSEFSKIITTKSSQNPWSTIEPQNGEIPNHWLRRLLNSQNLFPFTFASNLPLAIIPSDMEGNLLLDPSDESPFWQQLNSIYQEYSGLGKNTPKTLISQIDYAGKLSFQLENSPRRSDIDDQRMVVYPSSGDVMRASRYSISTAIVDSKLYRWVAGSADEAAYLTGILNAPSLRNAFKESRGSGRDFHLNLWRKIPIQLFDGSNSIHNEIARISVKAERRVKQLIGDESFDFNSQIAASNRIRGHLNETGIFNELDHLVQQILPNHTQPLNSE